MPAAAVAAAVVFFFLFFIFWVESGMGNWIDIVEYDKGCVNLLACGTYYMWFAV